MRTIGVNLFKSCIILLVLSAGTPIATGEDVNQAETYSTPSPPPTTETTSTLTTNGGESGASTSSAYNAPTHIPTTVNRTSIQYVDTRISGGVVRGYVSHVGRSPANIFKGVPMAEPPLGNLRFAPLRPRRSWDRIWNATAYRAACLSNTSRTTSPQHYVAEDCIYMNIYGDAKCKRGKAQCPVLFYIHGGGFAYDSATMFNETQIVQKYASDGVIFLTPAFRLGILGYMDLGNDDVVPRNLGFHDIIYTLKWTINEIKAFGGDPKQITVMGNSAGASAVIFLLLSPKVPKSMFQQAIISSGVPYMYPDANRPQTLEILGHFNCLRNNHTNRTMSDREKLHCMRKVNARELIIEQRDIEDKNLVFIGPEPDTDLLPGANIMELLPKFKARPLLVLSTLDEMVWFDNSLNDECFKSESPFGYTSDAVHQACIARYEADFNTSNPKVNAESIHSQAFLMSLVNTRMGKPAYRGMFTLANHTSHADDMIYFFGLHYKDVEYTPAEKLMDLYYPSMFKNFIKRGVPDKAWKPVDRSGKNYFHIDFKVLNGTVVDWPHLVRGMEDVNGTKFWLRDAAYLEKRARLTEEGQKHQQRSHNRGHKSKDASRQHNKEPWGRRRGHHRVEGPPPPYWLPVFTSIVLPQSNLSLSGGDGSSPTSDNSMEERMLKDLIGGAEFGGNETTNLVDNGEDVGGGYDQSAAIREVWSAFWLSLTVVVLLSIVIIMMLGSRMIYGYKNARGYSYNSGADGGLFTENSRIVNARADHRPRYM